MSTGGLLDLRGANTQLDVPGSRERLNVGVRWVVRGRPLWDGVHENWGR